MADKTVTVEQIASPSRRQADQRATLVGLGLNKIRKQRHAQGHARSARHDQQDPAPRPRRRRAKGEDSEQ